MSMKLKAAFLLALAIASAGCAKKVDVSKESDALKAADEGWTKSVTNVDTFVSFVQPDGVIMPPNEPAVSGTEAVRGWMTKFMAMPGVQLAWQPNAAGVAASGDVGYTSGTYDLHANGPDGAPISDHGKYLTVWKKDASGAWKVAYDCFNSDMAPMAAAPADTSKTAPTK